MIITFVHSKQSFLPEIEAYTKFFESAGIKCQVVVPGEIGKVETDLEWHFMGLDKKRSANDRIKIHEYTSASTAPLRGLKDLAKKLINVKPDYRIFLNKYVEAQFKFSDLVPIGYRDMGIDADWIKNKIEAAYKYDFIYIGDLSAGRRPAKLLDNFANGPLKNKTLLIVSHNYEALKQIYIDHQNIIFKGPYTRSVVRENLLEAKYGINYVIDDAPYNQQTSTKFLEYAACGLRIVSTDYKWVKDFASLYGGRYYYLDPDFSNLDWDSLENFNYSSPDLSEWTWEKQIKRSGVLSFIESVFVDIRFKEIA